MKTYGTVAITIISSGGELVTEQAEAYTDPKQPLVVTARYPGLAVKEQTLVFAVTHMATGAKIGTWDKFAPAKRALKKLLPLADWTLGQEGIIALKIGPQVRDILVAEKALEVR